MAFGNYQYNPYINPYSNPYNVQQTQFSQPPQITMQTQPPNNGFVWVDGIEEANSFYVAPNNAVQLWDKNAPCIYKKSADSTGKPTMQIFDLVERKSVAVVPKPTESASFVSRMEFDELKAKVESMIVKKSGSKKATLKEEEYEQSVL